LAATEEKGGVKKKAVDSEKLLLGEEASARWTRFLQRKKGGALSKCFFRGGISMKNGFLVNREEA